MLAKLGLLVTAIVFFALCLHCIPTDSVEIATLLRGNVAAALHSVNIDGVDVKANGRDILLTGKVPTEDIKAQAGQVAMALPGGRTVDNELLVIGDVKAVQTQLDKILLDKKIEFQSNSSVILPESTPVLQNVLSVLTKAGQLNVTINGHTDNSGEAAANRTLSQARAQHGIARERMKSAGYGPDKPIAPNDTREGRAKNRRVEIIANS